MPQARRLTAASGVASLLAGVCGLALSACTPTVYKPEVDKFSASVAAASDSFDQLVKRNVELDETDRDAELVGNRRDLVLSRNCSGVPTYIMERYECLRRWSMWRQNPAPPKPGCTEPAAFEPLLPAELADCQLGFYVDGTFVPSRVARVADASNHRRLANALAAYAAQLAAIVSSDDPEQLEAAVADAGVAANALLGKIHKVNPESDLPTDIGPIASLVGTALRGGLEAKRFHDLKAIATRADPAVTEASGRLSVFANQLYLINVVHPAFGSLDSAVERVVPEQATFPAAVEAATQQQRAYNEVISVAPGEVFHDVALAHREIVRALDDPSRQYDALRTAIKSLADKTKELVEVLKVSSKNKSSSE